ncbi:MAG: GNAT family N-acetyltransferase, partial [Polaromonas sp.]
MSIEIRAATKADAALILSFITELAIYEKAEHEVVATVADIETSLFASDAPAKAIICSVDQQPVG